MVIQMHTGARLNIEDLLHCLKRRNTERNRGSAGHGIRGLAGRGSTPGRGESRGYRQDFGGTSGILVTHNTSSMRGLQTTRNSAPRDT